MGNRFRELDGLRGIAALAVVASHFTGAYNSRYPLAPEPFFDFHIGAFGVQLFFLISGFVILMTAQNSARASDFAISRASRLYPAYWVALGITLMLTFLFDIPGRVESPLAIIANFSMVQRWFLMPNVDDVYWTLAIEMQFYVILLALLLIFRNHLSDRIMAIVLGMWLSLSLVVSLWASPSSSGIDPQLVDLPVRMVLNATLAEFGPLFSLGMLAYISRKRSKPHPLLGIAFAVAVLCSGLLHDWWYALTVAVICAVFLVVTLRKSTPLLTSRPLLFVGKISYSLYIVHTVPGLIIITLTMPVLGRDWSMLLALVVVLLLAWGLHEVAEVRGSKLLKRLLLKMRRTS
jgi:peptidoglycan/LPS O-acetylase OafA/YrhL